MTPANISVQQVRTPSEELAEAAIQLYESLMVDDPATDALTAGQPELIGLMARAMIKPSVLIAAEMYTAIDENGVLVGFTLWLPPGSNVCTTEEQRQMGLYQFLASLSEKGREYYTNVLGQEFPRFINAALGIENAKTATYYCAYAMVRTDYQGKGILKALFELVFPQAERLGVMMALATTNGRNVAIYNKLGFATRGYETMQSPWGEWPAWVFSRSATGSEK
ncbi:hypothetical protein CERSUDRAFT_119380 [Gelatoporia subvermispora B]|uniref:N-acetyltransferase domain-containing protein n=1 Tax=Ceriporiopsis subvermispora (strain B) TaxID=914234 RepID=M2Q4S2_CERS8|nr:hypothetical protein CERSUDRAFT_119380 [Gelatoporia subvermispora B]